MFTIKVKNTDLLATTRTIADVVSRVAFCGIWQAGINQLIMFCLQFTLRLKPIFVVLKRIKVHFYYRLSVRHICEYGSRDFKINECYLSNRKNSTNSTR